MSLHLASERLMGWGRGRALLRLELRQKLARRSAEQGGFPLAVGEPQLLACLVQLSDPKEELAQVEADALGARKTRRQRAEPGERKGRLRLREEPDCGGDLRLGVVRGEPRGCGELAFCRDGSPEPLQRRAVEQLPPKATVAGAALQGGELFRRREARDRGRHGKARYERRPPGSEARVEEALGKHGGLHVRIACKRLSPGGPSGLGLPGGALCQAEVEQHERTRGV